MKPKTPTTTHARLLAASTAPGGVERRRFRSESPRSITFTWSWVATRSGNTFSEAIVRACERAGWIRIERGALKPGVSSEAASDPLHVAIHDLRLPDRIVSNLTETRKSEEKG